MQTILLGSSNMQLQLSQAQNKGLDLNHNIVVLDPVELEESHDDGGQFKTFSTLSKPSNSCENAG